MSSHLSLLKNAIIALTLHWDPVFSVFLVVLKQETEIVLPTQTLQKVAVLQLLEGGKQQTPGKAGPHVLLTILLFE